MNSLQNPVNSFCLESFSEKAPCFSFLDTKVSELYQKLLGMETLSQMKVFLIAHKEDIIFPTFKKLEAEENTSEVFMDKDHKNLRVLSEVVNKIGLLTLGRLFMESDISLSSDDKLYYYNLSQYQEKKVMELYSCWCLFGEEVVDFSYNALPRYVGLMSLEDLQDLYGKEEIDRWASFKTDKWYIDKTAFFNLAKRPMSEGRCYGMSFDFIASYLEEMKSKDSSLEAIKHIASSFAKGASNRAECAQICQSAARLYSYPNAWDHAASRSTGKEFYWGLPNALVESMDDLLAQGFDLTLNKSMIKREDQDPQDFFSELSNGCHLVLLTDTLSNAAHAIALIKTDSGKQYIFDPNFGTLAVDRENFSTRCEQLIDWYEKEQDLTFDIIRTRLAHL